MFEKYLHCEVEQAILSRFMEYPNEISFYPDLEPKHFLFDDHRKIFETILKLSSKGKPVSPDIISKESGIDVKYISEISLNLVSNVKVQINYLIEESDKYLVLQESNNLLKEAEENKHIDIFSKLSELSLIKTEKTETVSNEDILKDLENRMKNGITGISTSIEALDDSINAFQKGRLYIVGARPSMGKTAFMCSLIEQIEKQKKVGIISLEMKSEELKQRMSCLRANIKHWKIEKGRCSGEEFDEYATALYSLKNVVINDKGGLNRSQIVSIIKMFVNKCKCDIVFIDHIGLIKINATSNLAHEIGENTSTLKALSKELNIPIVGLCQLNREVEKGKQSMPKISDLRDSGRIEEDADCVILLYRDNYYNQEGDGIATYIIGKCRNGKTGYVKGFFDSELMKWS